MTRRRYPSDHRRWFRVFEDILDDPILGSLSEADQLAWLKLLATFNRQRADKQGDAIVLLWRSALQIIGGGDHTRLLKRARRLSRLGVSFAVVPEGLLVVIPRWSEAQGLDRRSERSLSTATLDGSSRRARAEPEPSPSRGQRERRASPAPKGSESQGNAPHTTPTPTPTPTQHTLPGSDWGKKAPSKGDSKPQAKAKRKARDPAPEWATRLATRLRPLSRRRQVGPTMLAGWSVEIAALSETFEDATPDSIEETIDWLIANRGGRYVPVVEAASSLASKWVNVRSAMDRARSNPERRGVASEDEYANAATESGRRGRPEWADRGPNGGAHR